MPLGWGWDVVHVVEIVRAIDDEVVADWVSAFLDCGAARYIESGCNAATDCLIESVGEEVVIGVGFYVFNVERMGEGK
jgi:hypothetical protein